MGSVRQDVLDRIWRGVDPFVGFPKGLYEVDMQGWGSAHPYIGEIFVSRRPRVIVEVGVWKGATSIAMAAELRRLGIDGVVICVDTWLGSSEHWLEPSFYPYLAAEHGRPSLQTKFTNNVVHHDLGDYVVPLPLDSVNAAAVLGAMNIRPDVIHLDGGHDLRSVTGDLEEWWPLLAEGGLLIGDDYHPDTHWQGVRQAFDAFMAPRGLMPLENTGGKCRLVKPSSGV